MIVPKIKHFWGFFSIDKAEKCFRLFLERRKYIVLCYNILYYFISYFFILKLIQLTLQRSVQFECLLRQASEILCGFADIWIDWRSESGPGIRCTFGSTLASPRPCWTSSSGPGGRRHRIACSTTQSRTATRTSATVWKKNPWNCLSRILNIIIFFQDSTLRIILNSYLWNVFWLFCFSF